MQKKITPLELEVIDLVRTLNIGLCSKNTPQKDRKKLVRRGKKVIPLIGNCLKKIDFSTPLNKEFQKEIKRFWPKLLAKIMNEAGIDMREVVSGFDQWANWAANYRP